uniref:Secreted protein n=1 Tax=Heterorhabditis bacteriophora TaxID=37862 RepID=A0A1I7W5X3_HETBA
MSVIFLTLLLMSKFLKSYTDAEHIMPCMTRCERCEEGSPSWLFYSSSLLFISYRGVVFWKLSGFLSKLSVQTKIFTLATYIIKNYLNSYISLIWTMDKSDNNLMVFLITKKYLNCLVNRRQYDVEVYYETIHCLVSFQNKKYFKNIIVRSFLNIKK